MQNSPLNAFPMTTRKVKKKKRTFRFSLEDKLHDNSFAVCSFDKRVMIELILMPNAKTAFSKGILKFFTANRLFKL